MIKPGDYVVTESARFKVPWRGKVRRIDGDDADRDIRDVVVLVEWTHTDICTWVFESELKLVRRGAA